MVKLAQHSFLGGQMDFALVGRQDLETYARGATKLLNFLPKRHGSISKRQGTDYLNDITGYDTNDHYRLVPFAYTANNGWVIVFAEGKAIAKHFDADGTQTSATVTWSGTAPLTGSMIDEFDYCQSGDVMFIAHQDHEPFKIEHTVSGSTHTFTAKPLELEIQKDGRPVIEMARVTKLKVSNGGGIVTEYYKATAVYDGVETLPGEVFYGTGTNDSAEAETTSDVDSFVPTRVIMDGSTSYHAPWTESQIITLTIPIPTREADGKTPDEIRIYKKSGGTYGLIGTVSQSEYTENTLLQIDTQRYTKTASTINGTAADPNASLTSQTAQSWGIKAVYLMQPLQIKWGESSGSDLKDYISEFTLEEVCNQLKVTVHFGGIVYAITGESGAQTCTLTYTDPGADIIQMRLVNAQTKTTSGWPASGSQGFIKLKRHTNRGETRTITQNSGESDSAFETRWKAALETFKSDLRTDGISEGAIRTLTGDSATILQIRARVQSESSSSTYTTAQTYILSNIHAEIPGETADGESFYFRDNNIAPDLSITPPTEFDSLNAAGEYPACVCLYEQRLVWASTKNAPGRIMMSQIGDFNIYSPHETMVTDDPIDFTLGVTRFPKVRHMVPLKKLILFNGDSEWVVDSASTASGLTWETVSAKRHSGIGSKANLKPIVCNNILLFAEATGRAVKAYGYQLEDDGYGGQDVSIFAQSLFREHGGIVSWAFQQHPDSVLWCCMEDGTLASLTFNREHQTMAWAMHELGGDGKARQIVCTYALFGASSSDAKESEIILIVQRGSTYTLERMRPEPKPSGDTVPRILCLDSARTFGAGMSVRSGERFFSASTGEEVTAGTVNAIAGFTFSAEFQSVRPVLPERIGIGQFGVRCVAFAHIRVARGAGGIVWAEGVASDLATALDTVAPEVADSTALTPAHDENASLVTDNNRDGRINIAQSEQWPFEIALVETDIELEEEERSRR